MAFSKKRNSKSNYSNPEALFRDRRNRKVQGLLSHQSDILRLYQDEAFDNANVALELPTGSGKTLVGLLIGEFRRVSLGERILYLCPTRQLVQQVCEQSERKYGIKATPFTGSQRNFNPVDKQAYITAGTIAVAPYSALFNTSPYFANPQTIILDDAHASENYIAANWSLIIKRDEHEAMYLAMLTVIQDSLPLAQRERFFSHSPDVLTSKWVEKISSSEFVDLIPQIYPLLEESTVGTSLQYTWSLLRQNLEACHLYISYQQILIRPYIPPSLTHKPFASANQRVFMSATLGLGGDLERITGIPAFHRLPIPDGWDKQGIGRRFFIFPKMSLHDEAASVLTTRLLEKAGRGLVLVPNNFLASQYVESLDKFSVFSASDLESSKDAFLKESKAVAIFSNRYDGLDLPNNDCRLLIIDGLPKATNLQESFLMSKMASGHLLSDRIRTRIIQAFGRCTRNATDFAAIVVASEDFYEWLIMSEKQELFHPELQGELIFGIEQSREQTPEGFLENLDIFLAHEHEWNDVDADIREYRDETKQNSVPGEEQLLEAAALEVEYIYSLWNKNYAASMDIAQKVASVLASEDALRGLRGYWFYLAGSAANLAETQLGDSTYRNKAVKLYDLAHGCLPAVTWLRILASKYAGKTVDSFEEADPLLDSNVENIARLFESRSYASPMRFEKDMEQLLEGLNQDKSGKFEEAHKQLGQLLGFVADNSNGQAAPDPWWISNDQMCLVSEAKSSSDSATPVSVKYARQAASHKKWIRDNVSLNSNYEIATVMITPSVQLHRDVPTYADEVGYWNIEDFRNWANNAVSIIRKLQPTYSGLGNLAWLESVRQTLIQNKLDPRSIIQKATEIKLKDLPVSSS